VKLRRQWHSVEEVVGGALKSAQVALVGHPVDVRVAHDLPLVEMDATLIERVLYNLLENAGKYTPPGTPIAVAAEIAGAELAIRVSDRGPGIPEGQEASIFDKFTRGRSESATPGVGLGLAISRAIVVAHGGTIAAQNDAGGGACFTLTLPLGQPPATPDE
jgi:two-component system sensor histidine kinase KdpD